MAWMGACGDGRDIVEDIIYNAKKLLGLQT